MTRLATLAEPTTISVDASEHRAAVASFRRWKSPAWRTPPPVCLRCIRLRASRWNPMNR